MLLLHVSTLCDIINQHLFESKKRFSNQNGLLCEIGRFFVFEQLG